LRGDEVHRRSSRTGIEVQPTGKILPLANLQIMFQSRIEIDRSRIELCGHIAEMKRTEIGAH